MAQEIPPTSDAQWLQWLEKIESGTSDTSLQLPPDLEALVGEVNGDVSTAMDEWNQLPAGSPSPDELLGERGSPVGGDFPPPDCDCR